MRYEALPCLLLYPIIQSRILGSGTVFLCLPLHFLCLTVNEMLVINMYLHCKLLLFKVTVVLLQMSCMWVGPTVEVLSTGAGGNMPHLCLWALVYDAQHDSGAPYRPATLTLPFSTFWPTERASLFSFVRVTSTQDHASISNRLPNNQGLWWSLIPTAYVVFT